VASALVKGIALELTPATDKVHLKTPESDVYSADLGISRSAWHTFRMCYNSTDKKLYCYLDGTLVATLNYPDETLYKCGSAMMIYLLDGDANEAAMIVEHVLISRN